MEENFRLLLITFGAGLALIAVGTQRLIFPRFAWKIRLLVTGSVLAVSGFGVARVTDEYAGLASVGLAASVLTLSTLAFSLGAMPVRLAGATRRFPLLRIIPQVATGLAMMTSALVYHEVLDARELAANDLEVQQTAALHGRPEFLVKAEARTDAGRIIHLRRPNHDDPQTAAIENHDSSRGQDFHDGMIRLSPDDPICNCHGWVFTGGQYWVSQDEVETILNDNGYRPVSDPQPNDVVIYRDGKVVTHTAVVNAVTPTAGVLVEGKWGFRGVFIHAADHGPYGKNYTFYRSERAGHLLNDIE
jgi:hypothetical protein